MKYVNDDFVTVNGTEVYPDEQLEVEVTSLANGFVCGKTTFKPGTNTYTILAEDYPRLQRHTETDKTGLEVAMRSAKAEEDAIRTKFMDEPEVLREELLSLQSLPRVAANFYSTFKRPLKAFAEVKVLSRKGRKLSAKSITEQTLQGQQSQMEMMIKLMEENAKLVKALTDKQQEGTKGSNAKK